MSILGFQVAVFDGLRDELSHDIEAVLFEGLLKIPERPGLKGFDGILGCVVPGHDDAGQIRFDVVNLAHEFQSVYSGHLDITQHEIDRVLSNLLQSIGAVTGHQDFATDAVKDASDGAAIEFFVVNDEDVGFLQGSSPLRGGGLFSVGERRRPAK